MSLSGNNSNSSQNLENSNLTQDQLDGINQTLTGITYDVLTDSTQISNNVIVQAGKTLYVNGSDVNARITSNEQKLSGISYTTSGDLTTISNNVDISSGKLLYVNSRDVDNAFNELYTLFDDVSAINTKLTDISYTSDTTTINNNLTISTGKVLNISGYSNVKTALDNLNTTLTDINYTTDLTTINNNLTLSTGKILNIDGYSNVKTALDSLNTSLTGVSYVSVSDTTNVDNNLTIGIGKLLNIPNYNNVGSHLDYIYITIDHIVNEGTYTSIYNDFTIADGYKLKVSSTYTDVASTLGTFNTSINTINTTLTDISYSSDTTTINNNLTVSTGKVLAIDGYSNVKTTLDSLTSSINTLTPISNKIWEDDFLDGFNYSSIQWQAFGTGSNFPMTSELHHPGIVRLSCGNGDYRAIYPLRPNWVNFYWDDIKTINFVFRITGNDNYDLVLGISDATNVATSNIFLNFNTVAGTKMYNLRVNNFTIANLSTVPFTSGNWMTATITNLGGKFISILLKDTITGTYQLWTSSSAITTIDSTAQYNPLIQIDISDNPAKTLDIDLVSIQYQTNRN